MNVGNLIIYNNGVRVNWLNVILMSKYSNAVEYDLSSAVEITIYDKFNKEHQTFDSFFFN